MQELALPAPRTSPLERLLASPWALLLFAWGMFVAINWPDWHQIGSVFNDTDDAMRLVEVRDLLAGQGWFDLHQHRLDPPSSEPMHWSRLVDLPIAASIELFQVVMAPGQAEKLAMAVWPPLVFLATLAGVRSMSTRFGGTWAATAGLLLAATCMALTWQFVPGRIDHHNVQLALTVWTIACLLHPGARSAAASALCGIAALAVGLEVLPFLGLAGLCIAFRFVTGGASARERAMAFGGAMAIASVAAMAGLVPVEDWLTSRCDAMSAGYAALAIVSGAGLAVTAAVMPAASSPRWRMIALGLVGLLALAAFAIGDPACLRGPFGQLDPRLRPIWLDHVNEMQAFPNSFRQSPLASVVNLWTPILGLLSAALLLRDRERRRSVELWTAVACLAVALAAGLLQVRTMVYANLFGVPLLAWFIGALVEREVARGASAAVIGLGSVLATNGTMAVLLLSTVLPVSSGQPKPVSGITGAEREPCQTLANFADLAAEPPGLVANLSDLGPFILASTRHAILAAPYHRMGRGMLEADAIMRANPDTARSLAQARGVGLIALCTASPNMVLHRRNAPEGLAARLMDGQTPPWLVPLANTGPIRAFRVRAP